MSEAASEYSYFLSVINLSRMKVTILLRGKRFQLAHAGCLKRIIENLLIFSTSARVPAIRLKKPMFDEVDMTKIVRLGNK